MKSKHGREKASPERYAPSIYV